MSRALVLCTRLNQENFEPWLTGTPSKGGDDREEDPAESGIGDHDGAMEQYGHLAARGERVE